MVLLLLGACARVGRVLAPEQFVTPSMPAGELAEVRVTEGWKDEGPVPYAPVHQLDHAGVEWVRPVELTDRGFVDLHPLHAQAELRFYVRHDDFVPHDFRPVLARTGTLPGHSVTAVRFLPSGALGQEHVRIGLGDLQDAYNPEPVSDGDLLLVEVSVPGFPSEQYLFRARKYGVRFRPGAGVLVPITVPGITSEGDLTASPALVASLTVQHRWRTRAPVPSFLGEQLGLVASVGVGSTEIESTGLADPLGAFDATLAGGGIELFRLANVQALVNLSSAFRDVSEARWTLAVGVDAVRLGWVAGKAANRLVAEHPMDEDEVARRRGH